MKKYITYIFLFCLFAGCEDVLDKKQLDAVDATDLWNDPALANAYLNQIYSSTLPGFGATATAGMSDEALGTGPGRMMYGELAVTDPYGNYGVGAYRTIRRMNILINDIETGSILEAERKSIKGQALFLRAWTYWELVKLYGGVPMIMDVQNPNMGDALYMERDPAAKCIELIIRDLDEALTTLPPDWTANNYGRITRAAAAALKGRILLYYASPQFNPENLADRWTAAYEANKQAKEIAQASGHALNPNFSRIFLDESASKEGIFVVVFDKAQKPHGYENSVRPASVSNAGSTSANPTWNFVQAFPMSDGKPIANHPDYDPALYWKDRDPRFYATVAYNSMVYALPGDRVYEGTGKTRKQWTYQTNNQELAQNTPTGFYLRKSIDATIPRTETPRTPTDWIEIRYAEVLLNLAEAAAEVGKIEEAYTELKAIRKRAGIPAGADGNYGLAAGMSADQMREAIMLERQIELAFENKRHWDLRRRNLFDKKLNGTRRTGVQTALNTAYIASVADVPVTQAKAVFESTMRDTINWEKNYTKYFTSTLGVNLDQMDINYLQPKYNFYFIPQVNLDRDYKIRQTINWTTGEAFDPLAR